MRSNLRWCSDGLEFACWNGEIIRIGLHHRRFDREIIAWTAVSGAGISGSDVRGMMLEAVEKRFGSEMVGTCGEWDVSMQRPAGGGIRHVQLRLQARRRDQAGIQARISMSLVGRL